MKLNQLLQSVGACALLFGTACGGGGGGGSSSTLEMKTSYDKFSSFESTHTLAIFGGSTNNMKTENRNFNLNFCNYEAVMDTTGLFPVPPQEEGQACINLWIAGERVEIAKPVPDMAVGSYAPSGDTVRVFATTAKGPYGDSKGFVGGMGFAKASFSGTVDVTEITESSIKATFDLKHKDGSFLKGTIDESGVANPWFETK
jgi:hypothetical protein